MKTKEKIPEGFNSPIDLPRTDDEANDWQNANRSWWESHPMRYDWKQEILNEEYSKPFYSEIDHRFFSAVGQFMPWRKIPFDPLIDFDRLASQDVLEIGVGNGSHAQLLAKHSHSFTGIDITDYAVKSTTERLKCFDLDATILRMDAEKMDFADAFI